MELRKKRLTKGVALKNQVANASISQGFVQADSSLCSTIEAPM